MRCCREQPRQESAGLPVNMLAFSTKTAGNSAPSCCRELGASGCKSLLAVPISFVSEHIETLEEIDMEYRELAHESGIPGWGRVPALNTNPTFIDDLADAVLEALPYAGSMAGSNPSDSMVPLGEQLCVPYRLGVLLLGTGSVARSWCWQCTSSMAGSHFLVLVVPVGKQLGFDVLASVVSCCAAC